MENNMEQPEAAVCADNGETRPHDAEEGSRILGKFAGAAELAKAYESLQAEFTRKSQRLAELETVKTAGHDNACAAVNEKVNAHAVLPDRDEIIRNYLTSIAVKRQPPAVITTSHDFAFGSSAEPRSIREVGKLAENYFKSKELS